MPKKAHFFIQLLLRRKVAFLYFKTKMNFLFDPEVFDPEVVFLTEKTKVSPYFSW